LQRSPQRWLSTHAVPFPECRNTAYLSRSERYSTVLWTTFAPRFRLRTHGASVLNQLKTPVTLELPLPLVTSLGRLRHHPPPFGRQLVLAASLEHQRSVSLRLGRRLRPLSSIRLSADARPFGFAVCSRKSGPVVLSPSQGSKPHFRPYFRSPENPSPGRSGCAWSIPAWCQTGEDSVETISFASPASQRCHC